MNIPSVYSHSEATSFIHLNLSSELFLGHPDLKPEIKTENLSLLLTPDDWDKLKNDYIASAKVRVLTFRPHAPSLPGRVLPAPHRMSFHQKQKILNTSPGTKVVRELEPG